MISTPLSTSSTTSPEPLRFAPQLGHWLRTALNRFDARVTALMANHPGVPLGLANLAARGQVGAAHWHITRHLRTEGARLTDLASAAGMTKQAMGTLVNQCEAWGMVQRVADAADARARRIEFTPVGLAWLAAYQEACQQAQDELEAATSAQVATVISLGLEAYCSQ